MDDREPLKDHNFIQKIKGKLYADKGYIGQKLTELLFVDRIHLITSNKNNMKNVLMELKDRILLRKRSVIETVNDELKNICQRDPFNRQEGTRDQVLYLRSYYRCPKVQCTHQRTLGH